MFGLRARPAEVRAQATTWGTWPGESSMPTWSGMNVTAETSLQLLTVYGCVRMISDAISTLPWDVYREMADGTKTEVAKPDWLKFPTVDLNFTEWCSQVLSSLLLHGNSYCAVLRNGSNAIVELVPLDPSRVQVVRERGVKTFRINGVVVDIEILHIKGLMMPGSDAGMSPVEAARQSIGLGLATQQYGSQFFDGGANMPGVIEIPGQAQPDTKKELAQSWARKMSRTNRGKLPGVLDQGATWKPTGVTNEQAQFLATRQYTAAEIAGQMFLLDPSDLGIATAGSSLTYANLEQRNTRRVQVTFLPWIIRIEKALSDLLFNPRFFKFNLEGLLRGDTLSRYQSYQIGVTTGFLMNSEARDLEDFPPVDGVDDPEPIPAVDPQMNAAVQPVEMRLPDVHVHIGDTTVTTPDVRVTVEPAVVNVSTPEVAVDARSTVNVPEQPAPVVNVAAPVVPEQRTATRKTIERNADGQITAVIEETE